jgi:integrase
MVTRNVAALANGVKVGKPEGRTLTPEQARLFLASIRDDRLEAAFTVALALGLRRGELLALSWDDVTLDATPPRLTVTKSLARVHGVGLVVAETKTAGSKRVLHLPGPAVDTLRRHRIRFLEERLEAGAGWVDRPLGFDLIFRTPFGTALDPNNFRQHCYRVTREAFTPPDERPKEPGDRWPKEYQWSPHELRHSAASLLIAQGVPLKLVSETLGHASIRITADVYGHLLDDAGAIPAQAMSDALWGES